MDEAADGNILDAIIDLVVTSTQHSEAELLDWPVDRIYRVADELVTRARAAADRKPRR